MDQGRDAEAEPLLLEAHEILLDAEGPEASRTRTAARRLLALYERAGRSEDAARWRSAAEG